MTFFGKLSEIASEHLKKGAQIYIEGKQKTHKWQDKNTGQDRYSTYCHVDSFNGVLQMLGSGNNQTNKSNNFKVVKVACPHYSHHLTLTFGNWGVAFLLFVIEF